jgi:hypothetical protein
MCKQKLLPRKYLCSVLNAGLWGATFLVLRQPHQCCTIQAAVSSQTEEEAVFYVVM